MELEIGLRVTRTVEDINFVYTETEASFFLAAYLPGFTKDEIEVAARERERQIFIRGRGYITNQESVTTRRLAISREVSFEGFKESFAAPDGIDWGGINAHFDEEEHILIISIPKLTREESLDIGAEKIPGYTIQLGQASKELDSTQDLGDDSNGDHKPKELKRNEQIEQKEEQEAHTRLSHRAPIGESTDLQLAKEHLQARAPTDASQQPKMEEDLQSIELGAEHLQLGQEEETTPEQVTPKGMKAMQTALQLQQPTKPKGQDPEHLPYKEMGVLEDNYHATEECGKLPERTKDDSTMTVECRETEVPAKEFYPPKQAVQFTSPEKDKPKPPTEPPKEHPQPQAYEEQQTPTTRPKDKELAAVVLPETRESYNDGQPPEHKYKSSKITKPEARPPPEHEDEKHKLEPIYKEHEVGELQKKEEPKIKVYKPMEDNLETKHRAPKLVTFEEQLTQKYKIPSEGTSYDESETPKSIETKENHQKPTFIQTKQPGVKEPDEGLEPAQLIQPDMLDEEFKQHKLEEREYERSVISPKYDQQPNAAELPKEVELLPWLHMHKEDRQKQWENLQKKSSETNEKLKSKEISQELEQEGEQKQKPHPEEVPSCPHPILGVLEQLKPETPTDIMQKLLQFKVYEPRESKQDLTQEENGRYLAEGIQKIASNHFLQEQYAEIQPSKEQEEKPSLDRKLQEQAKSKDDIYQLTEEEKTPPSKYNDGKHEGIKPVFTERKPHQQEKETPKPTPEQSYQVPKMIASVALEDQRPEHKLQRGEAKKYENYELKRADEEPQQPEDQSIMQLYKDEDSNVDLSAAIERTHIPDITFKGEKQFAEMKPCVNSASEEQMKKLQITEDRILSPNGLTTSKTADIKADPEQQESIASKDSGEYLAAALGSPYQIPTFSEFKASEDEEAKLKLQEGKKEQEDDKAEKKKEVHYKEKPGIKKIYPEKQWGKNQHLAEEAKEMASVSDLQKKHYEIQGEQIEKPSLQNYLQEMEKLKEEPILPEQEKKTPIVEPPIVKEQENEAVLTQQELQPREESKEKQKVTLEPLDKSPKMIELTKKEEEQPGFKFQHQEPQEDKSHQPKDHKEKEQPEETCKMPTHKEEITKAIQLPEAAATYKPNSTAPSEEVFAELQQSKQNDAKPPLQPMVVEEQGIKALIEQQKKEKVPQQIQKTALMPICQETNEKEIQFVVQDGAIVEPIPELRKHDQVEKHLLDKELPTLVLMKLDQAKSLEPQQTTEKEERQTGIPGEDESIFKSGQFLIMQKPEKEDQIPLLRKEKHEKPKPKKKAIQLAEVAPAEEPSLLVETSAVSEMLEPLHYEESKECQKLEVPPPIQAPKRKELIEIELPYEAPRPEDSFQVRARIEAEPRLASPLEYKLQDKPEEEPSRQSIQTKKLIESVRETQVYRQEKEQATETSTPETDQPFTPREGKDIKLKPLEPQQVGEKPIQLQPFMEGKPTYVVQGNQLVEQPDGEEEEKETTTVEETALDEPKLESDQASKEKQINSIKMEGELYRYAEGEEQAVVPPTIYKPQTISLQSREKLTSEETTTELAALSPTILGPIKQDRSPQSLIKKEDEKERDAITRKQIESSYQELKKPTDQKALPAQMPEHKEKKHPQRVQKVKEQVLKEHDTLEAPLLTKEIEENDQKKKSQPIPCQKNVVLEESRWTEEIIDDMLKVEGICGTKKKVVDRCKKEKQRSRGRCACRSRRQRPSFPLPPSSLFASSAFIFSVMVLVFHFIKKKSPNN